MCSSDLRRHGIDVVAAPFCTIGKTNFGELALVPIVPILDPDLLARLPNQQIQVPGIPSYRDVLWVHAIAKLQNVLSMIILNRIVAVPRLPDIGVVAFTSMQNVCSNPSR